MEQIQSPYPENKSLAAIHRSWGFPTNVELLWLLEQGIDQDALWPIGGAKVSFDRNTFALDDNGERALIFRATDRGEVVDLIAWEPQTGTLASWRGQAFCLGDLDDVFNPATYFARGAVHAHETPLKWLLAARVGIVIVRPDLAHMYLKGHRVLCDDPQFAARVERWCRPPKVNVEILIAAPERSAA